MPRLARIIVAAALVLGGLTAPVVTLSAQAAAKPSLSVSPAKPIRGEKFTVAGNLSTAVIRPVVLQRKAGKKWKQVAAGKTSASGRFALSASTTLASLSVRVLAKKVKLAGKKYRAITSSTKKITTATQAANLSAPSRAGVQETVTASVQLLPARPGRPVQLQLSSGTGWTTIATAVEAGNGTAALRFSHSGAGTFSYRAVTAARNGAPAVSSNTVDVTFILKVTSVSAGGDQGCALNSAGVLKCWGYNNSGAVGDGTEDERLTAVAVTGFGRVTVVSSGGLHTCAVTVGGAAYCWGYNASGELGLGSTGTDSITTPRPVSGLGQGVRTISAGGDHTCALTTAGAVKCWGENKYGQVGDGTTTDRSTPVAVSGLSSGVASISAGDEHTCAVLTSGAAKCWGLGSDGQLGDGLAEGSSIPVNVAGLGSGTTGISAGWYHTCAVVSGHAKCWGRNTQGQLGDATNDERDTPVSVPGLGTAVEVTVGYSHSCVREQTGRVRCWGSNYDGKLGDGISSSGESSSPVSVVGISGAAVRISSSYNNTCVATSAGIAQCWGSADLGDGTKSSWNYPRTVLGLL